MKPTHKIGDMLYCVKGSLVYALMPYGWQVVITDELFLSRMVRL